MHPEARNVVMFRTELPQQSQSKLHSTNTAIQTIFQLRMSVQMMLGSASEAI